MSQKANILILVVAYEAESTLTQVLERIPESVLARDTEVLVIDDSSTDGTFGAGVHWSRTSGHRVRVLCNRENQGYGGNQKLGYEYAIRHGFDFVLLLHGDGQYAPEVIPDLLAPLRNGAADAVLGSRMMTPGAARRGGMPLYKRVGNRILTCLQNRLLGSALSEFHSGYRAYRVDALRGLPFQRNTDDFHFDTEIIIQLLLAGCRLQEVPIPTYYGDEICRVNGIRYALNVLRTTCKSCFQRWTLLYDPRFDVDGAGQARYELKLGYTSSHTMAIESVPPGAHVLDIGCGPGHVAEQLSAKGCHVAGMDRLPPLKKESFERFTLWDEDPATLADLDLSVYDVVLLLDVIEHLRAPEGLLDLLRNAVRDPHRKPTFVVTTGNVAFIVVRLQALFGQFNYGKQGILDLTHTRLFTFTSLRRLFEQSGYRVVRVAGIPAPFPKALGLRRSSRLLVRLNEVLIRLSARLFAYQIYLVATPMPTLGALLDDSIENSGVRSAEIAS